MVFIIMSIKDTAGQERFSSLSSAFFRGADAVMLMFDVNDLSTLQALTTWWNEFKEHAPLDDADVEDYCCVVVGNKMDLVEEGKEPTVSEADTLQFLEELIPVSSSTPRPPPSPRRALYVDDENVVIEDDDLSASQRTEVPPVPPRASSSSPPSPPPPLPGSHSIAISKTPTQNRHLSRSVGNGTIGTGRTTLSIYHTPSSSLFDQFHSARGSPEPSSHSHTRSQSPPSPPSPSTHLSPQRARMLSLSSSSSGMTITPSLFAQTRVNESNSGSSTTTTVPTAGPRDRGPRLFFTSARTGLGVQDVFEYAAKRVMRRWDEEERVMHVMEGSAEESVRLAVEEARGRGTRKWRQRRCCN
jgi:Ras-related protein Rab-7A